MKDILETALDDEDIHMVICLLKNDRGLMDHELTDSSTVKERLIQLNEYTIRAVKNKITHRSTRSGYTASLDSNVP